MKGETLENPPLAEAIFEKDAMLEYEIIVKMPPKKSYPITLRVESIKRAEPNIAEPDWPTN